MLPVWKLRALPGAAIDNRASPDLAFARGDGLGDPVFPVADDDVGLGA